MEPTWGGIAFLAILASPAIIGMFWLAFHIIKSTVLYWLTPDIKYSNERRNEWEFV